MDQDTRYILLGSWSVLFKNREISHKSMNFWLLLKIQETWQKWAYIDTCSLLAGAEQLVPPLEGVKGFLVWHGPHHSLFSPQFLILSLLYLFGVTCVVHKIWNPWFRPSLWKKSIDIFFLSGRLSWKKPTTEVSLCFPSFYSHRGTLIGYQSFTW